MYKSDYSLRKILKVAFKTSSFLNSNFAVPVATAGDVCDDPRDTVTVNSGVDAKLYYNRSNHEDDQHFRGYRAYAHSSVFAFLNKTGLDGACTHPVKEICLQGKAEFKKVNQSLLMIEIFNVAVNDSGKYKVVALFSYTHNDTETEKCLQVHHLNVSGKQWICLRFSSENNEISSNPEQNLTGSLLCYATVAISEHNYVQVYVLK